MEERQKNGLEEALEIVVDYLYQGRRKEQTIEAPELKSGIHFPYDELISVHSQEPTLEDIFIQYAGRRLS